MKKMIFVGIIVCFLVSPVCIYKTSAADSGLTTGAVGAKIGCMELLLNSTGKDPAAMLSAGYCIAASPSYTVAYNLKECFLWQGGQIFYRNLGTENTFVCSKGAGVRAASDTEARHMSQTVWSVAGVDIRRQKLIADDLSDGLNYGVCGEWNPCGVDAFNIPQGSSSDSEDDGKDSDSRTGENANKKGIDSDNEPSVPTPPSNPQPEPEVPIVTPVIESWEY